MTGEKINDSLDDLCTLITRTGELDEVGNITYTEVTELERFCKVLPVHSAEFYAAGTRGIKPQMALELWAEEYDGQTVARYDDIEYNVYRTYRRPDGKIELTLREEQSHEYD